jgi:hypothetical protein
MQIAHLARMAALEPIGQMGELWEIVCWSNPAEIES